MVKKIRYTDIARFLFCLSRNEEYCYTCFPSRLFVIQLFRSTLGRFRAMPGPFPGMDPYLEDPLLWRGLHLSLIFCMTEALNARLPDDYIASIDERVYVVQPEHHI